MGALRQDLADGKGAPRPHRQSLMVPRYDIVPTRRICAPIWRRTRSIRFDENAQSMFDFRADDVVGKIARGRCC